MSRPYNIALWIGTTLIVFGTVIGVTKEAGGGIEHMLIGCGAWILVSLVAGRPLAKPAPPLPWIEPLAVPGKVEARVEGDKFILTHDTEGGVRRAKPVRHECMVAFNPDGTIVALEDSRRIDGGDA